MRLSEWAAAPLGAPPPIPISTDAQSATDFGYRIGQIPPEALADDLASVGLTFEPETNVFRLAGERFDRYAVGDLIANIFAEAGRVLDAYLVTDQTMLSIAADQKLLAGLPYNVRFGERESDFARVAQRIEDISRSLPLTFEQLAVVARSFTATARLIRGFPTPRSEAVRRFRSVVPAPRGSSLPAMTVDEFLATVPAGPIARPDLHAAALAAGVVVGSRTLYAAAEARDWPVATRRGVRRYRVPESL